MPYRTIFGKWWQNFFYCGFYKKGDDSKKKPLEVRTKEEVDGVIRLLGLKGNEYVFDIPCGYGRHSLELAKRGFNVTASDYLMENINIIIDEMERLKLPVEAIAPARENMLSINYEQTFHALINMFLSFGFFETDEDNMQVLKNFYRALKPGGKFLMHTDVNVPRILSGKYKLHEIRPLCSGSTLEIKESFDSFSKRLDGVWIITDAKGNSKKRDYTVRVYEKDEFIQMCLDVGFPKCKAYGNWKGDPYSEDSEEVMFVATK